MNSMPQVSVIMPTFEQSRFDRRALDSLMAQTLTRWELIVIDDGSQDDTSRIVHPYLAEPRVRYLQMLHNQGLGQALNEGLERALAPLVAYLPSDDVYSRDHLQQLSDALDADPQAVLVCSGVRHHYNRDAAGQISGHAPQLVQCMHRAMSLRWITRDEAESDDLDRLFWSRPRAEGSFVTSGATSCEWVDHPAQRHKLMQEPVGGINPFRRHYRVSQPLRCHNTVGNAIASAASSPARNRGAA